MSHIRPNYRPDIDGLRAVAILGVLVFHIDPQVLSGGFVGVDVFFVISGYLITLIIDRAVAAGRFSLLEFYERRIRRIIPALFVVLAAVGWYASRVMLPHDFGALADSVRYAVFSASNFYFLDATQGYFDPEVSKMPLLHTWSLAVEEQFYVVFPLLILAGHRFLKSRRTLLMVLGGLGFLSLGLSQWRLSIEQAEAFYLLPWRAWEMGLGAFVALAPLRQLGKRADNLLGISGLAMILGSMIFYGEEVPFPGLSAVVPCLGATLVIVSGRAREAWVAKLLGWRMLVGIGLISYSVYLWHWPLIAFAKYSFGELDGMKWQLFAASLIAGFLSWWLVEQPFRKPTFLSRKMIYGAWAAVSVSFLGAAIWVEEGEGFPQRYSAEVQGYLSDRVWPQYYRSDAEDTYEADLAPVFGDQNAKPSVAVWGDSHAQSLLPMLDAIAKAKGIALRGYGMNAQMPMAGVTVASMDDPEERSDFSAEVLDDLKNDAGIRMVILQARWNAYLHGNNEQMESTPPRIMGQTFETFSERQEFIAARLRDTVDQLLAAGKQVVLVLPIPEPGLNVPDHVAKLVLAGGKAPDELRIAGYQARVHAVWEIWVDYQSMKGVTIIDPSSKLLIGDDRARIRSDGRLLYRDTNHLSVSGSMALRELFEPLFQAGFNK